MTTSFVYFASGNLDKVQSVQRYVSSCEVRHVQFEMDEPQTLSVTEVARKKVESAFATVQHPVFAEDFSAELDALNGLPGPLLKPFTQRMSAHDICDLVQQLGKSAVTMRLALALKWSRESETQVIVAKANGIVVDTPRGNHKYVMESIFQPEGYTKTWAEMETSELEQCSIRRVACVRLNALIRERVDH